MSHTYSSQPKLSLSWQNSTIHPFCCLPQGYICERIGNLGGGCTAKPRKKNWYYTFISKRIQFCTFCISLFPISTELRAYLALLIYTILYVVIFKLLNFLGWQKYWGDPPFCFYGHGYIHPTNDWHWLHLWILLCLRHASGWGHSMWFWFT